MNIENMNFETTSGNVQLTVVNDDKSMNNLLLIFNHKGKEQVLSLNYNEISDYGKNKGGDFKACIDDFFKFYYKNFGYFTMGAYKFQKYISENYPKLSKHYDAYNGSCIVYVDQSEHEESIDVVFNRLKEDYKSEILRFLKEFGLKMIDGKLDLNDDGYYYFEDTRDWNEEGIYHFGLSSMTDWLEYGDGLQEVLSLDINKIHYGL